jgi:hypothetical protein
MPIQSHDIRSGQSEDSISEGHNMYPERDDAEFVYENHEWMEVNVFLGLTT